MILQDLVNAVLEDDSVFGMEAWSVPTIENLLHCALGLSGEGLEILDEVKKAWRSGGINSIRKEKIGDEFVDLMIYVGKGAAILGIDLDKAWAHKHTELKGREWSKFNHADLYSIGIVSPRVSPDGSETALNLISWNAQGVPDDEQARRLGVTSDIVKQLQKRAGIAKVSSLQDKVLNASMSYVIGCFAAQSHKVKDARLVTRSEEARDCVSTHLTKCDLLFSVACNSGTWYFFFAKESNQVINQWLESLTLQSLLSTSVEIQQHYVKGFIDMRGVTVPDGSRIFIDNSNMGSLRVLRSCLIAMQYHPSVVFQSSSSSYRIALHGDDVIKYQQTIGFASSVSKQRVNARKEKVDGKRRTGK